MPNRLVALADIGLDDAVALCYLLAHRQWKYIDLLCVAGNVSAQNSLANCLTLLAHYDGDLEGVRVVDTHQIDQAFQVLPSVHGHDGMGDILAPSAPPGMLPMTFGQWLAQVPNDIAQIVSLGPATLAARVKHQHQYAPILLMGHRVQAEPNYCGEEFNYYLDPQAFEQCMAYEDASVASLDTCRAPIFNSTNFVPTDQSLGHRLHARAAELANLRHPGNAFVYDYIAVRSLVEPHLFDRQLTTTPRGTTMYQLVAKNQRGANT